MSTTFIARQYALRPTPTQERELLKCCAAARMAFNACNEEASMQAEYKLIRQSIDGTMETPPFAFTAQSKPIGQFTRILKDTHPWLREVHCTIVANAIEDCLKSWKRFFTCCRKQTISPPRYRAKHRFQSFTLRPQKARVIHGEKLALGTVGKVRAVLHDQPAGTIKRVTITRTPSRWIASVSYQSDVEIDVTATLPPVAIDRGIAIAYAASDGRAWEHPKDRLDHIDSRIRKLSRRLARGKKGGARRDRVKQQIARWHQRATAVRSNFNHVVTAELARHQVIAIEDLKIGNMTRSAAGTLETPGKRVAQKSGLNRSILNVGWGEFARQMDYKSARNGGTLIKVPAHHTSQTCAVCGHTAADNRLTQSQFTCRQCGHTDNADTNAARNILTLALTGQMAPVRDVKAREANRESDRHREAVGAQQLEMVI